MCNTPAWSFNWKKDLPPVAVLVKKILEEKGNQTASQTVKRKLRKTKQKIDDMMQMGAFEHHYRYPQQLAQEIWHGPGYYYRRWNYADDA